MSSLNRATIIGNLLRDPREELLASETRVAAFPVATNRRWVGRNGNEREAVEGHRVVVRNRLAEIALDYLSKGDRVCVEGRIEYQEWMDDEGRTRYTTEIVCRNLAILGLASGPGGRGRREKRRPEPAPAAGVGEEEVT